MSFLAPLLLFGLPLAALPVIIHLIHLHRRRTIPWAATMFLRIAQRMNRGFSRIRQFLILAARVLAVLTLIFVISRPLAGGWLGLTGGAPDTVLVLLDRSASMEQQNLTTGESKRSSALAKMAEGIEDLFGSRTKVVLIDSATNQPTEVSNVKALTDVPATAATDTAADLPAMLQTALDYVTKNQLGRTDVWIASDLRQADWNAAGGRWEALRSGFAKLEAVKFHVLAYPHSADDNLMVAVENVMRRETAERAELLMDIRVRRATPASAAIDVPVTLIVNGARSTFTVTLKDAEVLVQGHAVPLDKATKRGWGRVELPADANQLDNRHHFAFDVPATPLSIVVSDDPATHGPAKAVLASPSEPGRRQEVKVLPTSRASEIEWDKAALIVWQADLPAPEDILAQQLAHHVEEGRSVLFLPPTATTVSSNAFLGLAWGEWKTFEKKPDQTAAVEWWRTSDGLLANTRSGQALPVGELEVHRHRLITGDGNELAKLAGGMPMLMQARVNGRGVAAFLGTLPGSADSSLARDGIVWYALLQRALAEGALSLGNAQQREAGAGSLPGSQTWKAVEGSGESSSLLGLRGGVFEAGQRMVAVNRPAAEDSGAILNDEALESLFEGLPFHRVDEAVESGRDLANEIWRTFLLLMALAIILEALLCLPQKTEAVETRREVAA